MSRRGLSLQKVDDGSRLTVPSGRSLFARVTAGSAPIQEWPARTSCRCNHAAVWFRRSTLGGRRRRWGGWPSGPAQGHGAPPIRTKVRRNTHPVLAVAVAPLRRAGGRCNCPAASSDSRTESGDVAAPCSAGLAAPGAPAWIPRISQRRHRKTGNPLVLFVVG